VASEIPSLDTPEDDYEPPPHVFALLAQGAGGLLRMFAGLLKGPAPERTRWCKVWPTAVEAISYAFFVTFLPLWRLPGRYQADARWLAWLNIRLVDARWRAPDEFWPLVALSGAWIVLVGPLCEELLFRGLPSLAARALERRLSPRTGGAAVLALAAVSSLVFAWMHHRVLGAMPLPQLAFGALAWSVAWRRGLRYSVLLHVFVNFFLFAPGVVRIYGSSR